MRHFPTNAAYNVWLFRHSCIELALLATWGALIVASREYGWLDPFARMLGLNY
jgi:hypothetical protein